MFKKKAVIFFKKVTRVLQGTINAFAKNEDALKGSALTYYTLISIVPFLAVALGIATGFGFAQYLERELLDTFSDQHEVVNYSIQFARSLLKNVQGSVIAGIGVITLLWTNISLLNNIENALNDIWKVREPRTWTKKFSDYLAVMIICPIFFVVSGSLSVYLMTQITKTAHEIKIVELMSPFLLFLLRLTPFVLSILLFVVIYLFIPNAKIQTKPRIFAGILAGVAFQLWQWIYITFQVQISNYGAVYGTFAALPLFLLWLQISWFILLLGAELAAHIENEMSYEDTAVSKRHLVTEKHLGLLTLHRCIQAYFSGELPPTSVDIAKNLGLPLLVTQQMLDILVDAGVLVEVGMNERSENGYQPSKDASLFTIKSVCDAIEAHDSWRIEVVDSPALKQISDSLNELDKNSQDSSANVTLREMESLLNASSRSEHSHNLSKHQ